MRAGSFDGAIFSEYVSAVDRLKRPDIHYREGEALASGLLKERVDDYAASVVAQLGFPIGGNVRQEIERLGGRVHYESAFVFLEEDATIVVHGPNDFDIAMTQLGYSRRDRFTLAHELGHYLLHSKQGAIPMLANRKGSNRVEWEANWFAAGFLMPKRPFIDAVNAGRSVEDLADAFKVSTKAAEVRKKSLDV